MADAPDLGSGAFGRKGSSPLPRTPGALRRDGVSSEPLKGPRVAMSLSLHAEYLLGYLAGARSMHVREVVPLALAGSEESPQNRALLKALALGMSDGRRDRSLREAHEVRIHVLAMLTRESGPSRLGRATSEAPSASTSAFPQVDGGSEPGAQIEAFIEQASQIR